ncbi:MAG: DMT family transporter [Crinalium sp.]
MSDYPIFVCDRQSVNSETIAETDQMLLQQPNEASIVSPQQIEKVPKKLAFAALFFALVAISISAILVRLSESEISFYATAFHRFWITALILGAWLGIKNIKRAYSSIETDEESPASRSLTIDFSLIWRLIAAAAFLAADLVLWAWSLTQTTVANSTLLANLTPIFTCFLGWLIWKKTIDRRFLLGLGIAIAGVGVMEIDGFSVSVVKVYGDIAALVAALAFGCYLLLIEQLQEKLSTNTIVCLTSAIAAIFTLLMVLLDSGQVFPTSWQGWFLVVSLAIICNVFGQGLLVYSLTCLSPAFVAVVLLLDPVLAAIMSWIFCAEPISLLTWIVFLIVLTGIYLASSSKSALHKQLPL